VRAGYCDVVAVDGVDFEVAAGAFFTLLEPSGSGKTTTLRLIAGIAPNATRTSRSNAFPTRGGSYAALERIPHSYIGASCDLRARGWRTFRTVVRPLAPPGVIAGSTFTFSLTLGDYTTSMSRRRHQLGVHRQRRLRQRRRLEHRPVHGRVRRRAAARDGRLPRARDALGCLRGSGVGPPPLSPPPLQPGGRILRFAFVTAASQTHVSRCDPRGGGVGEA
jgi:energy-coupling factor transporter ATP-binding protein EcfA2